MTKKQLYIIVGIFTIIALGFLFAIYVISQGNNGATTTGQTSANPFANFFPFGKPETTTNTNGTVNIPGGENAGGQGGENNQNGTNQTALSILRQITKGPVAGFYAVEKNKKSYVDYIEKETGNVYETKLDDMIANRLSNSIVPRIDEAFFALQGKSIVVRYVKNTGDTIYSFLLDISKSTPIPVENATTTDSSLPSGKFLQTGITNLQVSSDEKTAFYLAQTPNFNDRSSSGFIYNFEKNTISSVFQSPFSEWLPVFYNSKTVWLQTKASQKVPGYLYSFDVKSGALEKIIGNINGLTVLPNSDGTRFLYSESTIGSVALHLYNGANNSPFDISLQTLPEKCVWTKDSVTLYCAVPKNLQSGEYPDLWYQGITSFSDNLFRVDTKTGKSSVILVPSTFTNDLMDMTFLTLSPNADFLYYVNKRDSSLWAFDLSKMEGE